MVRGTGDATASTGGFVNTGLITGPVTVGFRPVTRSVYRQQVQRIAPPHLVDRELELAELAASCTAPDAGSYVWWRAPHWAGKTALMSWFVLHPPAGVRLVSFFITARWAGQNDRVAFTEVVTGQLAELLGEPMPALTDATCDLYLLDLLCLGAEACAAKGERLILVVDGLDEDCGVTIGPDAHSIAALLPARPAAGMRIIVAGRANPPVPADVPDEHPLRDPAIVRTLDTSPHARVVKADAERELKRLLYGSPAEQDLLGLLTAACGGLSGPDLQELTGAPPGEIEDVLHTVSGRTFICQVSTWQPETGPEVYLLGHGELQATATCHLGDQRLAGYRDRLHAWADSYRAKGWPPGTPEYLLRGYYGLLKITNDLPRLIACATDPARHNRMLDLTGGDAVGLGEVTAAQDAILAQDDPDLAAAIRLARHHDELADRTHIPPVLPAVWAALGQHTRGEALARSETDPDDQAETLCDLAEALVQAGEPEQAETVARSITDPYGQARALAAVAGALAQAGRHEQAVQAAAEAEAAARSTTDPDDQGQALAYVAEALAKVGLHEQAVQVAAEAETVARSSTHPVGRAQALANVAGALARAGRDEQAVQAAAEAETTARSITDPDDQAYVLAYLARTLAQAGLHAQAETVARSITDPDEQARALWAVTEALPRLACTPRPRPWPGPSPICTGGRERWRPWPGRWPGLAETIRRSRSPPRPRPRPRPGPSPTRPGKRGRWRAWRGRWPGPASTIRRSRSPSRPRPRPGPSPTRTTRRMCWRTWRRRWRRPASRSRRSRSPPRPRPWRAPAATEATGRGRWRPWRGYWSSLAGTSRRSRSPRGPRLRPASSSTHTSRRGRCGA